MVKSELSSLRQRLQALHAEMAALLPRLLGREPLLPAYLSYRPRTCGNPGCKCARGERHPAWIVQLSAGGRRQCRSVPKTRFEALAGGECPEDIGRLKEDDGLVRVWPVLRKVSPRSALGFLMRFHDPEQEGSVPGKAVIRPETPALAALGRVNTDLLATVQRHHPVTRATLDVDASVHACDKKDALHTYEGGRGCQPVVAYWVEQRLMRELDRAGVGFAISADMTAELRAEIARLLPMAWAPMANADGTPGEPGRLWAEAPFVPDDPTLK